MYAPDRRSLIGGVAAVCAGWPKVFAATQCGANNVCTSGIALNKFETVRQRCENWCWAACIQAVFSLDGRDVEQEQAVDKVFGERGCRRASVDQIIAAINGEWIDQYGFKFQAGAELLPDAVMNVSTSVLPDDPDKIATGMATNLFSNEGAKQLVAELDGGRPLIIGALGHATVLTAVTYERSPDGFISLKQLVIRDPWPGSANRRTLQADEVREAIMVAKVWVG